MTKWPTAKARSMRSPVKHSSEEHEETPPPVDRSKVPCIGCLTWLRVLTCCSSLDFSGIHRLISSLFWMILCFHTYVKETNVSEHDCSICPYGHCDLLPSFLWSSQLSMTIDCSGILVQFGRPLQLLFSVCKVWLTLPEGCPQGGRVLSVIVIVFYNKCFSSTTPTPCSPRTKSSTL